MTCPSLLTTNPGVVPIVARAITPTLNCMVIASAVYAAERTFGDAKSVRMVRENGISKAWSFFVIIVDILNGMLLFRR